MHLYHRKSSTYNWNIAILSSKVINANNGGYMAFLRTDEVTSSSGKTHKYLRIVERKRKRKVSGLDI